MAKHRHGRAVGVACVVCALALCAALLAPAASATGAVSKVVDQSPAAVKAYWTEARMRHAQPMENLLPGGLGIAPESTDRAAKRGSDAQEIRRVRRYPYRTNGKVFLTVPEPAVDAGDYECSGTSARAPNHGLVWTAGHCGYDAGMFPLFCDCFVQNFEFVPAYRNGHHPFGEWPATKLFTTAGWKNSADSSFDLSAARIAHRKGKTLQDVVGGRRIGFHQPRDKVYSAFGYPAGFPFDGEGQYRCVSPYAGSDSGSPPPIRIACDMTEGASGGGWVIKRRRRHLVVSVASYGYTDDPNHLYGPYQGNAAKQLWQTAGG